MTRRRTFSQDQKRQLKFEDCLVCVNALTRTCNGCEMGEFFQPADEVDDVDEHMEQRWK